MSSNFVVMIALKKSLRFLYGLLIKKLSSRSQQKLRNKQKQNKSYKSGVKLDAELGCPGEASPPPPPPKKKRVKTVQTGKK